MNRQQTHAEISVGIVYVILVALYEFLRFSKTRMKHNASYNIISKKLKLRTLPYFNYKINDKE